MYFHVGHTGLLSFNLQCAWCKVRLRYPILTPASELLDVSLSMEEDSMLILKSKTSTFIEKYCTTGHLVF